MWLYEVNMDKNIAFSIVDRYFESWLSQDKNQFLAQLHQNVKVQECTGDVYNDKNTAKKWFEAWNVNGNKVLKWDIKKRFFDEENKVVVVTWTFKCIFDYTNYIFDGTSIIEFKDGLIIKLDEYQMEASKKYPFS